MAKLWLRCCCAMVLMVWLPCAQAQVDPDNGQTAGQSGAAAASEPVVAEPAGADRKPKSKALFWTVLVLALLFVLGSALALNGLGGKQAASRIKHGDGKDNSR